MQKDHDVELTLVCQDCGNVQDTTFRFDAACGDLIALYPSGEECESCSKMNLEQVE